MINIYKLGGARKMEDGTEYTIRSVNTNQIAGLVADGWVKTLDEVKPKPEPKAKAKAKAKSEG